MQTELILPGHPLFDQTLATPPPNWREQMHQSNGQGFYVADASSGVLRPATMAELDEYLYGGEYDERLDSLDDDDDDLEGLIEY